MHQESLKAEFTLQVDALEYLPESAFGQDLSAALAVTSQGGSAPFGQLLLQGAGQPPIGLYDELMPLASGIQARIRKLRAGEDSRFGSFSQPDVLLFRFEGGEVVVSNGEGEERRYAAAALIEALAACLDRLLALLRRVSPDDGDWQAQVARIAG